MKAWENRRAVFEGRDPLAESRRAKAPTFREAAAKTLEELRSQRRNAKHAAVDGDPGDLRIPDPRRAAS